MSTFITRKKKKDHRRFYRDIVKVDEGTVILIGDEDFHIDERVLIDSYGIPCRLVKVHEDYAELHCYIRVLNESYGTEKDGLIEVTEEEMEELVANTEVQKLILNVPLLTLRYVKINLTNPHEDEVATLETFLENEKLYEFKAKFLKSNQSSVEN